MSRSDGGARAASGLFYQYLYTIESFLDLVEFGRAPEIEVWIEDANAQGMSDPDVVDFSVFDPTIGTVEVHQAKSTADPDGTTISAAAAVVVLVRMCKAVDCPRYVLTTNARAGRGIEAMNTLLLQSRCAASLSDQDLLAGLRALCQGSTEATTALAEIDSADVVDRLRRAVVRATGETSSEIRRRIRVRLASWRVRHGLALSVNAAGLLENSLITQIFERAAGTRYSESALCAAGGRAVSVNQFIDLLALSPHLLSEAVGVDETSFGVHHVPSGEGIERPELLAEMAARLSSVRSRNVQRCALVGRSGIGKSRLAAMYAHATREAYDRVCWIDAESDAAILASVVAQRRTLGMAELESAPPQEVPGLFRQTVATFIGRWLIVFDNARHPEVIRRWLPVAGAAQVLVTSNNSVAWTAFQPVTVQGMTEPQATDLLISRLGAAVPVGSEAARAMRTIAETFDGWPLALQIVAAHFGELSTLVRGAETYLRQVADYVIDDESLDRDGYPHTLLAAIGICLDRLAPTASSHADAVVGYGMLTAGSVFASHAIPETLLFVATVLVEESTRTDVVTAIPDHGTLMIDRAVQRLRSESLIDRAENAPPVRPELRRTIEINEVVQRIVRKRSGEMAPIFNRVAAHLSAWLDQYMRARDYSAAVMLQPHAQAVMEHVKAWPGPRGELGWCATLAGNLALLLNIRGMTSEDSLQWIALEQEILDALPTPQHRLQAKTAHLMFQSLDHLGAGYEEIVDHAVRVVQHLECAAVQQDTEWEAAALLSSVRSWASAGLKKAEFHASNSPALWELLRRIDALQGSFVSLPAPVHQAVFDEINEILSGDRDPTEAIALIDAVQREIEPGEHQVHLILIAYRIESLSLLRLPLELFEQLARLRVELEASPETRWVLATILLDSASHLWSGAQLCGETAELDPVIRAIVHLSSDLLVSDYDRNRHTLLRAYLASTSGDRDQVRTLLGIARVNRPDSLPARVIASPEVDALDSWLQSWIEYTDRGVEFRTIVGTPRIHLDFEAVEGTRPPPAVVVEVLAAELAALWQSSYRARRRTGLMGSEFTMEMRNASNVFIACLVLDDPGGVPNRRGERVPLADALSDCATILLVPPSGPRGGMVSVLLE